MTFEAFPEVLGAGLGGHGFELCELPGTARVRPQGLGDALLQLTVDVAFADDLCQVIEAQPRFMILHSILLSLIRSRAAAGVGVVPLPRCVPRSRL